MAGGGGQAVEGAASGRGAAEELDAVAWQPYGGGRQRHGGRQPVYEAGSGQGSGGRGRPDEGAFVWVYCGDGQGFTETLPDVLRGRGRPDGDRRGVRDIPDGGQQEAEKAGSRLEKGVPEKTWKKFMKWF